MKSKNKKYVDIPRVKWLAIVSTLLPIFLLTSFLIVNLYIVAEILTLTYEYDTFTKIVFMNSGVMTMIIFSLLFWVITDKDFADNWIENVRYEVKQ